MLKRDQWQDLRRDLDWKLTYVRDSGSPSSS
jgi:hypothetical protein